MRNISILIIILISVFACTNSNKEINKKDEITDLNKFVDAWHYAAAVADEDIFFGSLDTNAVYLGTDSKERWLKHEFMDWGMKYFQRDTAWAFTPYNRIWYLTENAQYAWFDELLETHMGVCRGSGVLKKYENGWKIKHYNLAVTIPNEKMNEFRKLNLDTDQ